LAALADGYQQNAIGDAAYEVQRAIESGERVVVGLNAFADEGAAQRPEPQVIDPDLEAEQVARTRP
jgi:methylmalonyl-CoA mutase N-terminal domain/subunit